MESAASPGQMAVTNELAEGEVPLTIQPADHVPWYHPPRSLAVGPGEVHLWRLPLKPPHHQLVRLGQLLSNDERARADRYKLEHIRRRFIAARGQLRQVLSRYLDEPAERIAFRYESLGKPFLAAPWDQSGLHFNLSDSHEMALCSVTAGIELGADVERIRAVVNFHELARRFFAESEINLIENLDQRERLLGFFNCWTRKEAYLKAVGSGLSFPLNKLEVTVTPGEPARLLTLNGSRQEALGWHLAALVPMPGYVAALAMRAPINQLDCYAVEGSETYPRVEQR